MKLSTSIITLLFSSLVVSRGLSLFSSGQHVLDDSKKVPGTNPLEYCTAEHAGDILELEYADLSPNPPKPGQTLTITAKGKILEDIQMGAYVLLTVKYGLIKLVSTTADLCEQIKNVDMECPVDKGVITITKKVEIPNEVPPGKYTVWADAYTVDDEKITCMQATVVMSRG